MLGPKGRRKETHHPIVQKSRYAAGHYQHVARVRVAMEETVLENLLVNEFGDMLGDRHRIDRGPAQSRCVHDVVAGNKLHRHNFRGRELAKNNRHLDPAIVGKLRAKSLNVGRFIVKIEFLAQGGGKLQHHPDGIDAGNLWNVPLDEPREIENNGEIQLDDLLNVGPLNLDRYSRAIRQLGGMHLRNGCACHRLVIKLLEELGDRSPKLFRDDRPCLVGGKRGNLVLQLAKLHVVFVGDQIAARTDNLAKLDEGRSKFFESEAHSFWNRLGQQSLLAKGDRGILYS